MSTISKIDPSTLGWVKTEIDETLKQARLALESFAENKSDNTRLRFCITYLHQVLGTLQMVELDGAAMLAQENQLLAEAMLDGKVEPDSGVFEVLIRGILSLPDYLARLQFGQPDAPLRLLPLINELRTARSAEPLADVDLFAPDLSVRPPTRAADRPKVSEEEYSALARSLRPAFQAALLNWLRDPGNVEHLAQMSDITTRLEQQAGVAVVEQLFWVAGGLIDAMGVGGLEPTNDRKRLFARLEQQIKRVIDNNDKSLLRNASEALVRSMLFQVGHAAPNSDRLVQLRAAFGLDALLPGTGVSGVGESYDMPTPEALQSVATALGKEIESAQDLLSAYFESAQEDGALLEPLLELLHKMSGTMEMLGVALLKALVDEVIEVCQAMKQEQIANPESASMPIASALLLIENSTRDIHKLGLSWKRQIEDTIAALRRLRSAEPAAAGMEGIELSDTALTDTEFKQLIGVVAGEIRASLSKVEDALETFAAEPAQVDLLESVPQHLSQIQGAMQILGQERAADLTAVASHHVRDIQSRALVADNAVLDALAVAVGTIGAYIEGLERDRPNLDALIDNACTDLAAAITGKRTHSGDPQALLTGIETGLGAWLKDNDDRASLTAMRQDLQDLAWIARTQSQEKIERIANEMNALFALVVQDPAQMSADIGNTLQQSFETLATLTRQHLNAQRPAEPAARPAPKPVPPPAPAPAGAAAAVASAPAKKAVASDDLDEDIILIFIEDAREMIDLINKTLPAWHTDPADRDVLLELRRAFHTLKGSGRMVGASEIAELAWAVENMLNRVREGKVSHSDTMFELLHKVQAVLPEMVMQLEGGPAVDADIGALRATADAIANNAAVPAESRASDAGAQPPPQAEEPEETPKLDATLLQIFTNETRGHLATLKEEINRHRTSGVASLVTEDLLRAVHTLAGSSRSLNLRSMAEACADMERLLQAFQIRQLPLDDEAVGLMERTASRVARLVDDLNANRTLSVELQHDFADLAHAFRDDLMRVSGHEPAAVHGEAAPAAARVPHPSMPAAADEIQEELDPELLEIFLEEAVDILASIEEALGRWRGGPDDKGAVDDLKRSLHTLKGGARMAGAMTMGTLAHNTESLLKEIEEGRCEVNPDLLDVLDEVHDALVMMVDQMQNQRPVSGVAELNAKLLIRLAGDTSASAPAEPAPAAATYAAPAPVAEPEPEVQALDEPAAAAPLEPTVVEEAATLADDMVEEGADGEDLGHVDVIDRRGDGEDAAEVGGERSERRGQIRVRTSLLNELVNFAGEVSISRARMEQQIFGFRENLSELNRNVSRFRDQIRELEIQSESQILARAELSAAIAGSDFDPLEFDRFSRLQTLSRSLAESLHDLFTIQSNMDNFIGQAETVLQQQARVNTELQEGLMRTRMVSFATQAARLRHIVRQTARELGKRVELQIGGSEVEVDRTVLERMVGPFEHMIRNAVDHGIESDTERRRAGKPPVGKIAIDTSHEGSEIVIRFSDDGAGLNIAAIRQKAADRGLIKPGTTLSDEELIQFILVAGFSTAGKVTHLSGRGVGMDVVHNEVKQLGGSITVDTKRGVGTTFIIRLPLTLSITQALMVNAGEQTFAVPLSSVINILEVPVDKLNSISVGNKPLLNHEDQVYPFMHLGTRLGIAALPRTSRKVPVLLARSGGRQVAIQVDGLSGTREVVIKPVGVQLSEIEGLAGATILGDGRVILILDIPGLWITEEGMHVAHGTAREEIKVEVERMRHRPLVMVVDDSITVRKVTARHLQKRGMDVIAAKDGIDAIEQLREQIPDVMLVDIEMPRMDGYELTTHVRSDATLRHIPIIMITSRAGSKHKDRALQLGVNLYMTKPYLEDDLFQSITSLLPPGSVH